MSSIIRLVAVYKIICYRRYKCLLCQLYILGEVDLKKIIYLIIIVSLTLFRGITAFAGDIPESLLSEDKALLFFGELVSCDKSDESITITVLPTQKIKGDVNTEDSQTYYNVELVGRDGFTPTEGETYLMAYYDQNNPLYVFRVTTVDTKTLTIEGIAGIDMWERMQGYLNEGAYEKKETERLASLEESTSFAELTPTPTTSLMPTQTPKLASTSTNIEQKNSAYYWSFGLIGVGIVVGVIVYLRIRKK